MRRNQLYSIETSIRTAIPPKDYKPPVDPRSLDSESCWCFGGPDDDDALEPMWAKETVKGKAVIHRCERTDEPLFDIIKNEDMPNFYPLWGLGPDTDKSKAELESRLGAVNTGVREQPEAAGGRFFMTENEQRNREMGQPERLAVVIPCYNEDWGEIEATMKDLTQMVKTVNEIAAANGKPNVRAVVIIIQDGIGKSSESFREAMEQCTYQEVGSEQDDDFTTDMQWTNHLTIGADRGNFDS